MCIRDRPRQVRHRVLPQCVDLLLRRGEEGHPVAYPQHVEAGRVPVPRCFRSVERFAGSLPDGSVQPGDHLPGEVIGLISSKTGVLQGSRFFVPDDFSQVPPTPVGASLLAMAS